MRHPPGFTHGKGAATPSRSTGLRSLRKHDWLGHQTPALSLKPEPQPLAAAPDQRHQPPELPPPLRPHTPRLTARDPRRSAARRNPGATARTHASARRHHDAATHAHDPPPGSTSTSAAAAATTSAPSNAERQQRQQRNQIMTPREIVLAKMARRVCGSSRGRLLMTTDRRLQPSLVSAVRSAAV